MTDQLRRRRDRGELDIVLRRSNVQRELFRGDAEREDGDESDAAAG